MRTGSRVCLAALFLVASAMTGTAAQRPVTSSPREVLNTYCVTCHNQKLRKADLMLDKADIEHPAENPAVWEKVLRKLRAREMPPPQRSRPDDRTYDSMAQYLETALDRAAEAKPNPGRPSAYRLNRSQYANAIRDPIPLDAEYVIKVRLQRGKDATTIVGNSEQRELDIRLDGSRLKLFTVNASDDDLEVRVAAKAGPHTVAATFLKDTVKPEGILDSTGNQAFFEGVGTVSIGGPYGAKVPGDTPSRRKIFICRP